MKNIQKIFAAICFIAIAAMTFTGCVDQDFDQPEVKVEKYNGKANITIAELKALLPEGKKSRLITEAEKLVVSGYVVSSDKNSVFYKQLIIQDKPENPTAALSIDVNVSGITGIFPVGQQIFIELGGLSLVDSYGVVKLSAGIGDDGKPARIPDALFYSKFFAHNAPVEITPLPLNITDFKDDLLGCLIQLSEVQFDDSEMGENYFDENQKLYTSRIIINKKGNTTTLKVSKYATFSNDKLPQGSGKLAAILNTYAGSYELIIRSTEDVDFTGDRFKVEFDVPKTNATIEEIKAMRKDKEFVKITEDKIIEGVVISSDEQGNFYKTLVIQETKEGANLRGIEIAVNAKDLYKKYPVGQKVVVKCKDLIVADNYGVAKLGGSTYKKDDKDRLGGIEEGVLATTIIKNGNPIEVTPKVVKINELTNDLLSCLIKFEEVQFTDADKDKNYGEDKGYATRTITDANGMTVVMSTSSFAKFAKEKLPQGSGSIVSVLNTFSKKFQLNIRSTADVDMNNARFDVGGGGGGDTESNATIEDIQNMRQDKKFVKIEEDKIIEGVVISSDEQGNFYKTLVIQETKDGAKLRGIQIAVNVKDLYKTYPVGQKVFVKCKGLLVADNYGVAKLGGNTYKDDKGKERLGGIEEGVLATTIIKNGEPMEVTPKVVKITDLTNDLLSCLVKFEEVQFTDADKDKTYGEDKGYAVREITDKAKNIVAMSTSSFAKFAKEKLPQGSGSIVSVLNTFSKKFQLNIRSTADVDMTNDRFGDEGGDDDETESNATIEDIQNMRQDKKFVKIEEDKIIEGVVISSDEQGNFYKTLVIQETKDGAKLRGIQIAVNVKDLYKTYPVGQKVFVKCKGLLVADNFGVAKLGGSIYEKDGKKKLGGIEEGVLATTIIKNGNPIEVTPKVVKINELDNDLLSCLIKFEEVQFTDADKDKNYGEAKGYAVREITDKAKNIVAMSTSSFAKFAKEKLPQGSGSIVSVLNIFSKKFQLNIRSTADVDMTNDRFGDEGEGGDETGSNATIEDIQNMRQDKKFVKIEENKIIEGVVISSDEQGNFYKTLVIQETKEGANLRGIQIAVNVKDLYKTYPVGQKVLVKCKGLLVADNFGIAKLGAKTYVDKKGKTKLGGIEEDVLAETIVKAGTPIEVTPKVVKINELTNDLLSCLIKFEEVQFTDADKDKTYGESTGYAVREITDKAKNIAVMSTSKYAKFIKEQLPQGSGSIVSVLNIYSKKFQLNIRSTADVDMNDERFGDEGGDEGDDDEGESGYLKPEVDKDGKIIVKYTPKEYVTKVKKGQHMMSVRIPKNYYTSASSLSGQELRDKMQEIVSKDAKKLSYNMVWTMCENGDQNPNNKSQVWQIYVENGISKKAHVKGGSGWNREHVWAKSHGNFGTSKGPGTDGHHLRASDAKENSNRGNLNFADVSGARTKDGSFYEPPKSAKGDVARAIFYMAVRYGFKVDNSGSTGKAARMGKLDELLKWNEIDPVDPYEIRRNNVIYDYQNNRNPFIDHPELVQYIFGKKKGEAWKEKK